MLRILAPQGSLFELFLPAGMQVLSGELAAVDRVLDDKGLLGPFGLVFHRFEGRPSIPVETYLRLMFLKTRFGLGYERLTELVADSLSWRRFCRIGLEAKVPDESTIRKLTRRCGPELIEGLNRALLRGVESRLDMSAARADTTVVEADVRYPTDSGLLCEAVSRLESLLGRLNTAGCLVAFTARSSEARALQHSVGVWLRRRSGEAKAEVLAITGQLADLAAAMVADSGTAPVQGSHPRAVRWLLEDLAVLVRHVNQVIAQARVRVAGGQPDGATRLVSFHDPDARPIRKGRLGKPVEFGYKAQTIDNTDGLVIDYSVHIGNPSDTVLLRPAIENIQRVLHVHPDLVTADRGYWDSTIEADLAAAGVTRVVIPRTGKPSAARAAFQQTDEFITTIKWRTGCEGRISCLKRDFGWRRARLRGHDGARICCGHGVFAHNIIKLTRLKP